MLFNSRYNTGNNNNNIEFEKRTRINLKSRKKVTTRAYNYDVDKYIRTRYVHIYIVQSINEKNEWICEKIRAIRLRVGKRRLGIIKTER